MSVTINAFFRDNEGLPATGLTPTIRIWQVRFGSPSSDILIVSDASMLEVGDGFYKYEFVNYDNLLNYVFRADGGISLNNDRRYAIGSSETASSTETATTINNIVDLIEELLKYQKNRTFLDKIAKTLTIYDDDGTTVLRIFSLRNSGGTPSTTEIVERLPL